MLEEPVAEIATLLCHVHEHYFKRMYGDVDILNGFIALFGDMNLLSNEISPVELHILRKNSADAQITFNKDKLSYEQFYSCLRRLAMRIYGAEKKSFRLLLENHIIPLASSWDSLLFSPSFKSPLSSILLKGLLHLDVFLRLLYYAISKETHTKSISIEEIWSTVVRNHLHVTMRSFFGAVQSLGWQRLDLDTDVIRKYILSLVPHADAPNIHTPWYYAQFVLIIAKCAALLEMRLPRIDGMHTGLYAMLQVTADTLLQSLLDRFVNLESEASSIKSRKRVGLQCSAFLWMIRQSGLISQPNDLLRVYVVMKKYINDVDIPVTDVRIPFSAVIPLLCEVVKTLISSEQHNFCNSLAACSHCSETSSSAVYLALSQPMLLFAQPRCVPSVLASLYALPSVTCIHDMQLNITRIAKSCEMDDRSLSISLLCDLLVAKNVIPKLIRYDAALKMILYVIDMSPIQSAELASSKSDMTDVDVSTLTCNHRELCEILFSLSQIIFNAVQSDITPCLVLERQVRETKWEWAVNKLLTPPTRNSPSMPKICIDNDIDRFYCLLEICDPELNGEEFCDNMSKTLTDMMSDSRVEVVEPASLRATLCKFSEFANNFVDTNWPAEDSYNLRHRLPLPLLSTAIVHLVLHYPTERVVFPWTFFSKICEAHSNHTRHVGEEFAYVIMEKYASEIGCSAGDVYEFVMSVLLLRESISLDESACRSLVQQATSYYFSTKVQSLLELSKDILFYEYLCCCFLLTAQQKGPFLEGNIEPSPSYYSYLDNTKSITASKSSIVSYLKNRFPEAPMSIFDFFELLFSSHRRINFSLFVYFLVACNAQKIAATEDAYVIRTKSTLFTISSDHERTMKSFGISFVNILISEPMKKGKLSAVEEEALLKLSLQHFNGGVRVETVSPKKALPPSPPLELWDVPRFIQFCRVFSIFPIFDSILHIWKTFGRVLVDHYSETRLSVWDDQVVGPLPVLVDYDKLSLILSKLIIPKTVSSHVQHMTSLEFVLSSVIAPRLAAAVVSDAELHADASLEDMLRFGGDRVMNSLDAHYVWISDIFDQLTELGDSKEPQILTICRYLTSIDILNLGQISLLAKQSLSPRLRQGINTDPIDVTMCRTEFEELLLRCAFAVWDKAGGLSVDAQKGEIPPMLQRSSSSNDSAVQKYNSECESLLMQLPAYKKYRKIQSKSASKSTLRSWGVDFLSPLLLILKLFAQFPQSTSLKKQFSIVPAVPPDDTALKISQLDVTVDRGQVLNHENYQQSAVCGSPETSPEVKQVKRSVESPSRLPLPTATPTKLLRQPDVKHRSNELLSSILAMRNKSSHAAVTPPRPPRQEKIIVHDLSPTVRISNAPTRSLSPPPQKPYTSELVESTKEALWPVFATYCSCGDSLDPGKLSGPNLLALLSKLDLLSDDILLSDVILLFHRISAQSLSLSPVSMLSTSFSFDDAMPPMLTFEEFLVYLCAYAMLKFEKDVKYPACYENEDDFPTEETSNEFLNAWMRVMESSKSFSRLMIDFVLPRLRRQSVLASPEDARHRDMQVVLFTLDIVFHVERIERKLRDSFFCQKNEHVRFIGDTASISSMKEHLTLSLQRIRIVPHIISISLLNQLVHDILPSDGGKVWSDITFPQYEWLVCVVAFAAVRASAAQDITKVNSKVVGEIIETLVTALLDVSG